MPEIIDSKNISEFWTSERCFILEILNDPAHPKSSLALARVPPGVTTQLHRLNATLLRKHILLKKVGEFWK